MKLVDWNCKRCNLPLPDEPFVIGNYIDCPRCGARHYIDREYTWNTYENQRAGAYSVIVNPGE